MTEKFVSERNLKFLLYEVLDTESLLQFPYYSYHTKNDLDILIDTAVKIGRDMLRPHRKEMDENPPVLIQGKVKVHPAIKTFMRECGNGGWISAAVPLERGGQQLPHIIDGAARFIFAAANYSASVYPMLTTEAANLLDSFGAEELKSKYLPNIYAGKWQGTMALTEPQAGSSLADITTIAEPTNEGYYKIRGQKTFISASDYDGAENIVHLMLVRIKGAPAGIKGISLFVVPRERIDEKGNLVSNDVSVAGVFHKMGYRGCPICQLSLGENGDCRGYLVGEPHKGLNYMFQAMNDTRVAVGMGAAANATAAYYASLQYTRERTQGRKATDKNPLAPQVPIFEHADIKRMLVSQRSVVEGALSLLLQCGKYADLIAVCSGEEKENYDMLLDLLTPVAKTYPSEMGLWSVSQGLQCLGGYGYCEEYPLAQYFREARINPIHEGTTGIQSITLLGRNVTMKDGKAFRLYLETVRKTIREAEKIMELKFASLKLAEALTKLETVTSDLVALSQKENQDIFLANATLYMEFFGIVAVAWQWLLQAIAAQRALASFPPKADERFYKGKLCAFRYFFGYEIPKTDWLSTVLLNTDGLTASLTEDDFFDG